MTKKNDKRYKVTTACPQCGCSTVSHLPQEEIEKRFGDVPNVQMDCHECMLKYEAARADVCAEWDAECQMMQKEKSGK